MGYKSLKLLAEPCGTFAEPHTPPKGGDTPHERLSPLVGGLGQNDEWLDTPHNVDLSHHDDLARFMQIAIDYHQGRTTIDHVRRVWVENGWREIFAPGLAGEMMAHER